MDNIIENLIFLSSKYFLDDYNYDDILTCIQEITIENNTNMNETTSYLISDLCKKLNVDYVFNIKDFTKTWGEPNYLGEPYEDAPYIYDILYKNYKCISRDDYYYLYDVGDYLLYIPVLNVNIEEIEIPDTHKAYVVYKSLEDQVQGILVKIQKQDYSDEN